MNSDLIKSTNWTLQMIYIKLIPENYKNYNKIPVELKQYWMTYLGGKGFVAEKCDVEHWCWHTLVGRLLGNPGILYRPHNAKNIKTERMFTQETL